MQELAEKFRPGRATATGSCAITRRSENLATEGRSREGRLAAAVGIGRKSILFPLITYEVHSYVTTVVEAGIGANLDEIERVSRKAAQTVKLERFQ